MKKIFGVIMLLAIAICVGPGLQAQPDKRIQPTVVSTTISKDFVIQIDKSAPIADSYSFNISQMGFKSEAEAEAFFRKAGDNVGNFTLDYYTKTATINLSKSELRKRNWNQDDLEFYFNFISLRMNYLANSALE